MLSLRVPLSSALPLKILLQLSCSGGAARGSFSAVVFRETPSSSSAAVGQVERHVVERGIASIEEKAARGRRIRDVRQRRRRVRWCRSNALGVDGG